MSGKKERLENEDMISVRIKLAMKNKKISQVELAKRVGTTQAALSQMLNSKKGYVLKKTMLQKICRELDLDYQEVLSAQSSVEGSSLTKDDYERSVTKMFLDRLGVDVSHIIVSAGLVFRADKYTNFQYSCGTKTLNRIEMEKKVEEDKQVMLEEGLDEGMFDEMFEEYYEIRYKDRLKKLSVAEYNKMIDSFTAMNLNSLDFIFAY